LTIVTGDTPLNKLIGKKWQFIQATGGPAVRSDEMQDLGT